jgi:hypothetical protein
MAGPRSAKFLHQKLSTCTRKILGNGAILCAKAKQWHFEHLICSVCVDRGSCTGVHLKIWCNFYVLIEN